MRGVVYALLCNNTQEVYFGSCREDIFNERCLKHIHSSNKCSSKQIIDRDNYDFFILEFLETDNKRELCNIENYYISNYECINKRKSFRTYQEKLKYNREYHKIWYKKQKENKT